MRAARKNPSHGGGPARKPLRAGARVGLGHDVDPAGEGEAGVAKIVLCPATCDAA
jgi:hypothetical protein